MARALGAQTESAARGPYSQGAHSYHPAFRRVFCLAVVFAPYSLRALFSHSTRFFFCLSFLQATSALASFCARVSGFDLVTAFDSVVGATLPGPENTWLAGAPSDGDEVGVPRHPSPVHAVGPEAGAGKPPLTRAS